MSGSFVLSAALWAAAVAATIWILVPAIAFAFDSGGFWTEILPDVGPPAAPDEVSVFGPRLGELGALGFRIAARTRERGRFISPTHWSWQSHKPAQWLVSPDNRTFATLYRLIDDEPARVTLVTIFDDGGLVRTSCPGAAAKAAWRPDYWRLDLRGVDAATLLARHQEQVEAFGRERGTRPKASTVADIAAADHAAERPVVRKMAFSGYGIVGAFLPALLVLPMTAGRTLSWKTPLVVCFMAGFYALIRWLVHGPLLRAGAKRSHTHSVSSEPDDIAPDGRILATGKYERRLRALAAVAAVLACGMPIRFLRGTIAGKPEVGRTATLIVGIAFTALSSLFVVQLVGRARGRMVMRNQGERNPAHLWLGWAFINLFFAKDLDWSKGIFHRVMFFVAGLSIVVGLAGWRLEKKRGQS